MKWYWKLLIALVLLLLIGYFSIDYLATRVLKNKITLLKEQVKDDYTFQYKSLKLSLVNRTIVLKEFEFHSVVDSLNYKHNLNLKLDKLFLKYSTLINILTNQSVDILEVVLRQPEISFGLRSHLNKSAENEGLTEKIDSNSVFFIDKITLEEFTIESGKIDFYRLEKPDDKIVYVNDLDISINGFVYDLAIDSFYISNSVEKPLFSFKEVYKNDLKKHDLSIDEIQYFFDTKELTISNFHFENNESPESFRKTLNYRSPWFSINIPQIQIKINPRIIYDNGIFYLPKLELTDAKVTISNDLNFPIKPGYKAMPGKQITAVEQNFLVDSLILSNAELTYIHKAGAAESGFLKFSKMDALAVNITDIDSIIQLNPFLDLKVSAMLWDEGRLNSNFRMDLSSSVNRIDVKGSLRNMAFNRAENMVKPLYGVEIKSGNINNLAFDFSMNENKSVGNLYFEYVDLLVDLKVEDKTEKQSNDKTKYSEKSSGILNFVVNNAVKASNQPEDKKFQAKGNIILDRNKEKPVFDLLWNSIAIGMMDVVVKDAFFDSKNNYQKNAKKLEKEALKQEKNDAKKGLFNKKKKK